MPVQQGQVLQAVVPKGISSVAKHVLACVSLHSDAQRYRSFKLGLVMVHCQILSCDSNMFQAHRENGTGGRCFVLR